MYFFSPSNNVGKILTFKPRRCVFFDLGANNGDSLQNFFGLQSSGGGGDFKKLLPNYIVERNTWIAHAYEANPFFNKSLSKIAQQISKTKHNLTINYQTAAWLYDGTIDFYLDTVNPAYNYWGSSLNKNAADVVHSNQTKVTVACHDIAKRLMEYDEDDIIVMKIDIEGAEYDLLVDFIKRDVLKLIDYIAIEYHRSLATYKHSDEILDIMLELANSKKFHWY